MLGIIFARTLSLMRRYLAALLFVAARVALFALVRAFRHRFLNKRLLHNAMLLSSAINHFAILIAFGRWLRRRRRYRP